MIFYAGVRVSEEKAHVSVVMPQSVKTKLQKLAKAEDRSLSNYMLRVLTDHAEKASKKK